MWIALRDLWDIYRWRRRYQPLYPCWWWQDLYVAMREILIEYEIIHPKSQEQELIGGSMGSLPPKDKK